MKNLGKLLVLTACSTIILNAADGADIAQKYGCMGCHAIVGKKNAPAFRGVANRNLRFNGSNAKTSIINSIKNGSKGKYPMCTNSVMPPFPNISDEELNTLADWILSQAGRRGQGMGQGMGYGQGSGRGISY